MLNPSILEFDISHRAMNSYRQDFQQVPFECEEKREIFHAIEEIKEQVERWERSRKIAEIKAWSEKANALAIQGRAWAEISRFRAGKASDVAYEKQAIADEKIAQLEARIAAEQEVQLSLHIDSLEKRLSTLQELLPKKRA